MRVSNQIPYTNCMGDFSYAEFTQLLSIADFSGACSFAHTTNVGDHFLDVTRIVILNRGNTTITPAIILFEFIVQNF